MTARELFGGLAAGLMYYAFAYWLYLYGLRHVPASRAASFFSLIPVFGIACAYVALGERLTLVQSIGALTILASVAIIHAMPPASQCRPIRRVT